MVVWNSLRGFPLRSNSHDAENYYHKPGPCSATSSFHTDGIDSVFKGNQLSLSPLFSDQTDSFGLKFEITDVAGRTCPRLPEQGTGYCLENTRFSRLVTRAAGS
jgi:hypothetical protein